MTDPSLDDLVERHLFTAGSYRCRLLKEGLCIYREGTARGVEFLLLFMESDRAGRKICVRLMLDGIPSQQNHVAWSLARLVEWADGLNVGTADRDWLGLMTALGRAGWDRKVWFSLSPFWDKWARERRIAIDSVVVER